MPKALSMSSLSEFKNYLHDHIQTIQCISFDIFDTLLARCIEPPEEIQRAVAHKLAEHLGENWTAEKLFALRQMIEKKLRQQSVEQGFDHECNFVELCHLWAEKIQQKPDAKLAKFIRKTEFELENAALYVKDDVIDLLHVLKELPIKLIAISDMYLDGKFINKLLYEKNLLDYFDAVYVSADSKLGKYTGRLYQHVQAEQQLRAQNWIHIGDNPVSDRREACKLGIQGIWLYEKAEIKRRKCQALSSKMAKRGGLWKGRFFYEAIAQRFAKQQHNANFFYQYGLQVLGAAFSAFTQGLLERLAQKPVDKVFFLARDGYLFHQLFKNSPTTLDSDYIYMSRRVITAAAMAEGLTHEQAIVAFYNPKQQGLYSVFKVYDLPEDRLMGLARQHGFEDIKQPIQDWNDSRLQQFLADKTVQKIIREHGVKARALLEKYLEQIDFFDCQRVAFVDIGWNGTIQKFLKQAFGYRDDFPVLFGYYFAFVPKLYHDFGENNFCEGIIHDSRRDNACERIPAEVEEIFEQAARSAEGTTLAYRWKNNQVVPVLKADSAKDRQAEIQCNPWVADMQAGILEHYRHYQAVQKITGYQSAEVLSYVHGLLERAIVYPSKQETHHLTQLVHTEDFGHDDILDIGKKAIRIKDILQPIKLFRTIEITAWRYALFANIPTSIANFMFRVLFLHAVKK